MKALHKKGFFSRLSPYNKPTINIVFGVFFACLQGCTFPVFGVLMGKALFGLMEPDKFDMKEKANEWILYMAIVAVASFIIALFYKYLFGIVAENITINVRSKLYGSILQKHMGWFDHKENSAGVMIGVLASDV